MPTITDFDAETIRNAADHLKGDKSILVHGVYGRFIIDLAERLTPVKWTEPVPGVHVAVCNGWSLAVSAGFCAGDWELNASSLNGGGYQEFEYETIDAAMSAAVEWARKHPVEAKQ